MNIRKALIATSIIHHGNWDKIYLAIQRKEVPSDEEINQICDRVTCGAVTIIDPEYPQYLKEYYHPPFVLFYYGDFSLVNDYTKNIAVVGTRKATSTALKNTDKVVQGIAKKLNVVSGLAKGIDAQAHESAIKAGGKTIAILGCGIDLCYPSCNEELYKEIKTNHLLISEYFNHEPPNQENFPHRNRLISMFSNATLVPEAHFRSGTSITISYTMAFNRQIFCIPSSNLEDSLCNSLIHDGAILVRNSDDILYELGL